MPQQSTLRSTFRQKNRHQQSVYHLLKDEPEKVMQALLNRYLFLAMVESGEYSDDELSLQLIESNAALAKAIDINNAIARRQGINIFIAGAPSTKIDTSLTDESGKKNQLNSSVEFGSDDQVEF
jgi:hypothetical protein